MTQIGAFTASDKWGIYPGALEVRVEKDGEVQVALVDITIPGPLVRANIFPESIEVGQGEIVTLSATGYDANGIRIPSLRTEWAVLDPRVGTIDGLGDFVAGEVPGVYEHGIQARLIQRER